MFENTAVVPDDDAEVTSVNEESDEQVPEYNGPYGGTEDADAVRVDLYDVNKGKAERTGGPYMDEIAAEEAEKRRAKLEGREPDLDNPPATAATQLVPKHYLRESDTDKSHYSDLVKVTNKPVASVIVDQPKDESDPKQGDWDNDQSKIDALKGAVEYEELKQRHEELVNSKEEEEPVTQDSPQPEVETPQEEEIDLNPGEDDDDTNEKQEL